MHSIRLAGPWEFEVAGTDAPKGKISMPADRLPVDGSIASRVRLTRRFGRPTGLASGDVVWLVVERAGPPGEITLNGRPLGQAGVHEAGRFDVTADLADRNRLEVEVDLPLSGPPLDEVRLEIHAVGPEPL